MDGIKGKQERQAGRKKGSRAKRESGS